jgi:transglutaminase-like putative cysteine protease/predicted glutamine amidotransferase
MSFEGELAPSFDLRCLQAGRKAPDGWGIGWYPGGEPAASVLKEPAPPAGSIRSELVRAWEHLESSLFLLHIRRATWGQLSDANTQPFCRSYGGRDWLLGHSGSLNHRLEQHEGARFVPVGATDTELIFCELMSWIADHGWKSIGDIDLEALRAWLDELNDHGSATLVFSDGHDLCVYADRNGEGDVYLWNLLPPFDQVVFGDADLEVDLTRRGVKSRKGTIVSTTPLVPAAPTPDAAPLRPDPIGDWRLVQPGRLVVIRQGAIRAEVLPPERQADGTIPHGAGTVVPARAPMHILTQAALVKRLEIQHRTVYRYATPVERSTHLLRLEPVHDLLQGKLEHELRISVDCKRRTYEDVFGNRVVRAEIDTAFSELVIEARSRVELRDVNPLAFRPQVRTRSTIPLIWMPWQRHMLQPYLLPPELPETQLVELTDYAMSFVERNDHDLLETLIDMNLSIFREYKYQQGSTTLGTTPFDVYANRRGVCQDFANLFICMARLLSVPARYVCGYIYTGPKNANKIQSEASHAWVEMYLPEVGWRGFDPTNGILTQTDHVRVAHGRTYVDATPTSGTIFVGGGPEVLEVSVRCEPCE